MRNRDRFDAAMPRIMLPQSQADAPPPYTAAVTDDSILRSVTNAMSPSIRSATSVEAEKLRCFMIYLLAVDYSITVNIALTAQTRSHYLQVTDHLLDARDSIDLASPADRNLLVRYLRFNVHEPAAVLGVPSDMVVYRLTQFRRYLNVEGSYGGATHETLQDGNRFELACRFQADIEVLLPRLLPPADPLRRRLLERFELIRSLYFVRLLGLRRRMDVRHGDRAPGHTDFQGASTKYLEEYLSAREVGMEIARPSIHLCDLGEEIKACMNRLQRRAQNTGRTRRANDTTWHPRGAFLDLDFIDPPF